MAIDAELAAFCERERARVVGMLSLYVGDAHVAEELTQEAMVRVCQHWPRVRSMSNQRGWLNRVALNLARSFFRRRAAARRAMARHGRSDDECVRDEADAIAVRQAVAALPPRMRQALILRHFEGLSVRGTAGIMGCAEGTVKALTSRAIGHLRDAGLADEGTSVSSAVKEFGT